MSAEINYKSKYMELRAKYMNDLDMAFRLGFEQGGQQAQQDQAMQAQQDQMAMDQAAMQGQAGGALDQPGQEVLGQPNQPGAESEQPGQESAQPGAVNAMAGQPTELDQHISKLESAIAKSENGSSDPEIKKLLENLVVTRKAELMAVQMKKNEQAISSIAKALHKPSFKMSKQASHNLNSNAKSAVSMQHKIVSDVMEKMEAEERKASTDIKAILNLDGLTKKS